MVNGIMAVGARVGDACFPGTGRKGEAGASRVIWM